MGEASPSMSLLGTPTHQLTSYLTVLWRFSTKYGFEKPNDKRALDLMNAAARAVVSELPDITIAYGVSDEYSFVFHKTCALFERRSRYYSRLIYIYICILSLDWDLTNRLKAKSSQPSSQPFRHTTFTIGRPIFQTHHYHHHFQASMAGQCVTQVSRIYGTIWVGDKQIVWAPYVATLWT